MIDPELERAIKARLADAKFAQWLGMELTGLTEGRSELRLRLQPHHLNPGGIAHGGVIASLLDAAIGLALRTKLGMRDTHVTVQLQINYLKAVWDGVIVAHGEAVHSGSRVGYGEGRLTDEGGTLLARATATFLVIQDPAAPPGDVRA